MNRSDPARIPRVAIILLNWNSADDTLACLDSLAGITWPAVRIIVVDNASADDSVSRIRARFPAVTIIENSENTGFSEGNNTGIRFALAEDDDLILLLNNDTVVAPDFLEPLVEALLGDPRAGIAGPLIYYHDEPDLIWYAGGRVRRFQGRGQHPRHRELWTGGREARETGYVTGCAMLIRAGILREAGLLEPAFFYSYEDLDYALRVRRYGYRLLFVPRSVIWHRVSASLGGLISPVFLYYQTRNRLLFMKRQLHWYEWPTALGHYLLSFVVQRFLVFLIRRRERAAWRAVIRGIGDFLRGRFGPCDPERL